MGTLPTYTSQKLNAIRNEIDAIDHQVLELLHRRAVCSRNVVNAKKSQEQERGISTSIFRPLRELSIHQKLEAIIEKQDVHYSKLALHHIWRTIIAASVCMQGNLNVYCQAEKKHELQRYCDYIFGFQAQCQFLDNSHIIDVMYKTEQAIVSFALNDDMAEKLLHENQKRDNNFHAKLFMELSFIDMSASSDKKNNVMDIKEKKFLVVQCHEKDMQTLPNLVLKNAKTQSQGKAQYSLIMQDASDESEVDGVCLGKYVQFPFPHSCD